MINKALMYIVATLGMLTLVFGGIAWYKSNRLETEIGKVEVLEAKIELAPIENNITSIASKATGVIEQIGKEEEHEEDNSIGTHNTTF